MESPNPNVLNSETAAEEVRVEDFEQSLKTLQDLVQRLESREMSLAESLECYKQASHLTKVCEEQLSAVDKQVREITERMN